MAKTPDARASFEALQNNQDFINVMRFIYEASGWDVYSPHPYDEEAVKHNNGKRAVWAQIKGNLITDRNALSRIEHFKMIKGDEE